MRVLFCGGGTGGHVYPALTIASVLATLAPYTPLYVGAEGEMEETLVARAGIPLETLPGGGLHGVGPINFVRNLVRLARGFLRAWRVLGRFQPHVVFLTGGYVSVPVASAAWLRRRPILVYLPDVEPGRAIKLLSRIATCVAVTVEDSRRFLADKVVVTGYPVRPEFHAAASALKQAARATFGIPEAGKVLLVMGGSRGARSINQALGTMLEQVLAEAHVIHVSGTLDAATCRARWESLPEPLQLRYHLHDYLHEMAQALAAADLVVARAGAATLGEFPILGLPAILVPYPHAWRYQKVNADYLVERGAAIRLDDERMGEQLWPTIAALFNDADRLEEMSGNARALAQPDAAVHLASLLQTLAHTSRIERGEVAHGGH
jgi:UDP-N-acetylglucosamine--N-acetylmuramyl-(pentapeptide) pyrophosphoryl-undecaprenol N-acetylglucosamine transferase